MGMFTDFRDVLKGLKRKKRGEATVNVCPRCGSKNLSFCTGLETYPGLYGIAPRQYLCAECGYKGPIVLEQPKKDPV